MTHKVRLVPDYEVKSFFSAFAHLRPEMTLLLVEVKPWKRT